MDFHHISVLLNEVIENLDIKPGGVYIDGTLGGGGHSLEIVKRLGDNGRLIGIDRDGEAIEAAGSRLRPYQEKITLIRSNYDRIREAAFSAGVDKADGILLDLGVSSHQLDVPERGFSYREDALLDMRMDDRQETTAADLINNTPEEELTRIIRQYGEERFAARIAKNIVKARQDSPVRTTFELNEIISESIPARSKAAGGHPSKRTFQAIRIALNGELESLEKVIPDMIDMLDEGGRLCIITFHSLEDRIVKNEFRNAENPCTCPPDFPVCVCGKKSKGRVITKKAIIPSENEMESNPRSKSAKLRVFEKNTL